ncbi:MAG: glycogen-binding domain-containing protein [Proteobacteria bacterium]|nr:glycogen-binding domain-containing protein [Pseudomonadota bacterium]
MSDRERLHRLLDGEESVTARPAADSALGRQLAAYEEALSLLTEAAEAPPAALVDRVMEAIPDPAERTWGDRLRSLWPRGTRWVAPALAGALASLLLAAGVGRVPDPRPADGVAVAFEVHAPGAQAVELVGSFNGWRAGEILLQGPDATGHWTTTVRLPEGRHEYLFLVDGKTWITDPRATAYRPDGFGHRNALIEL